MTSRYLRRAALLLAGVALVAGEAHLIDPYVARAAGDLRHPVLWWVAIAAVAEFVSLLATARLRRHMLATTGTAIPLPAVVGLTYVDYAMSVSLPAGPVVSAGYTFRRLRRLGATIPAAGFTLLSTGVLSSVAYGLLAVAGFSIAGGSAAGPGAVVLGLVAGGLLVWATRGLIGRPELLERIGRRALRSANRIRRREPDAGAAELQRSIGLFAVIRPRGRDWAAGMATAVTTWVTDLGCLVACCYAVGADGATVGVVLLAYLAGTSVSGVSVIPGGLGVADAAMILVLVRGGVGTAPAAAAVILYRILSFGLPVVAGWSAWIGQRRAGPARGRFATVLLPHVLAHGRCSGPTGCATRLSTTRRRSGPGSLS